MKILIAGDLVLSKKINASQLIDQEIINLFKGSNYNIVNLEAPITNSQSKIVKTGPHLKSIPNCTKEVLSILDIDLVTLANNHIMDYDEKGVKDTIAFCKENSISVVGAGINSKEAALPIFINSSKFKIGVVNIAENEWATATEFSGGANGMSLIDDVLLIQKIKDECDFVFVIIHGGHEYYNLPSPRMQKQYRFYIDNGADLIVGHHPHCISGMEIYKNKKIYYSLGNFLFTLPSEFNDWYNGIVLQVEITDQKELKTSPIFIKQSKQDFSLSFVKNSERVVISEKFMEYSKLIENVSSLNKQWLNFILEKQLQYENYWSPLSYIKNRYLKYVLSRVLNRITNYKFGRILFLNLLRCEAHADLSKAVLDRSLK